jgi:Xaa-Pro aminopeptidase
MRNPMLPLVLLGALCLPVSAQPVLTGIFPPSEHAARRARVMEQIGDAAAIVLGTTERPGEQPLRQNNQFFYLTGVVEPRAVLIIDGRTKRSTLFLNPRNVRSETLAVGPGLYPGEEAVKTTGIEAVLPRGEFTAAVAELAKDGRTIYTPFRAEVLGCASFTDPAALWRNNKSDPWDGRPSREEAFVAKLKEAAPHSDIRDLDPILDTLRVTKSPLEIGIIREATRIGGLGMMEAMRDARPGMYEYQLQADLDFVYKEFGSYGAAYYALIGTGTNTMYTHYHKDTARLAGGDLVQIDYGPDYKYYVSDITRVFPANGRFTPRQREFYGIYLALYRALMSSIKVHAAPADIVWEAVGKMDAIMASYKFTDPKIKDAASRFVERYRTSKPRSLGHFIGMEVHDVGRPTATLEPGQIFTIEPAMTIPDEHIGMRLEDVLLVTQTGIENLSAFVPIEMNDIEKLMAQHRGLSDAMIKLK